MISREHVCDRCRGTGYVVVVLSHWDDELGADCETDEADCPECDGEGVTS